MSAPEEGVYFDLNANGQPVFTGWPIGKGNAFLVRDLNQNGQIDSGAELFGDATLLKNGERAPNGFVALRELDADGDGYITAKDPAYAELRLWIDENHDGYTDPGELHTLAEFHIESLNLSYLEQNNTDVNGNQLREKSTFSLLVDNTLKVFSMIDVWFRTLTSF